MPKLTKTILDASELRADPYFVWCSELPGFGARVFPTGKKSFYCDYRTNGQRRRMSIGAASKMTVEEARKAARMLLGGVLKGEDPAMDRKTRRMAMTVAQICDEYLQAAQSGLVLGRARQPKKPSTLYVDRGRIERHIKPLLGKKIVTDVTRADIKRFIDHVTLGKTAKIEKTGRLRGKSVVQGGAGTAARTAGLLSGIFAYAVANGAIAANPVHGVARAADGARSRRLLDHEYKALGTALDAAADVPWQVTAAVRLLAFTGCRRGEIANLKWVEVDSAGSALRLGDSKTGASIRPLTREAAAVLESLPRTKGAAYVLPGVREPHKAFGALQAGIERVMGRAGLDGVTAHTLRHSFASVAADLDYSDSTIGAMLGHAGGTITSKYTHRLDSVLLAAANKVAGEIYRQMTGEAGKVVELPRRA